MDITTLLFDQETVTRIAVNDALRRGKAENRIEIILSNHAQNLDPALTCQVLGITREEYDAVVQEASSVR